MSQDAHDEPVTGAQSFILNSSEIEKYHRLAEDGDKDAAFKLYQYYNFGICNEKASHYWLKKAASSGHKLAQQHLKVAYESESPEGAGEQAFPR